MKFNFENTNESDSEGRTKAEILALFPDKNADSVKLVGLQGGKYWEIEGAPLQYHLDQLNKEKSDIENVEEKKVEKTNYEERPRTKKEKREDRLYGRD